MKVGLYDAQVNRIVDTKRISIRIPSIECIGTDFYQLLDDSVSWPQLKGHSVAMENARIGNNQYFTFRLSDDFSSRNQVLVHLKKPMISNDEFGMTILPGDRIDLFGVFDADDGSAFSSVIGKSGCVLHSPHCSMDDQSLDYVIALSPREAKRFADRVGDARAVRIALNDLE